MVPWTTERGKKILIGSRRVIHRRMKDQHVRLTSDHGTMHKELETEAESVVMSVLPLCLRTCTSRGFKLGEAWTNRLTFNISPE
jgi:hypothetical protein